MSPSNASTKKSIGSSTSANTSTPAVGLKQGEFDVDVNGQATFRIPIEVPPGMAGCQPHLELVYVHRQPNGLLGVGWNLAGLSTISRTKATYAVDGFDAPVAYDRRDRYSLDGQRLINVEGEYGQPGTLYYTEIQTWQHVRAEATEAEGFTVVAKNGEVSKYGGTADSVVLAAGSEDVRLWALSSVTDRNGNSVQYSYTQTPLLADGSRGAADQGSNYIDRISYGSHNGTAANRFVQFIYERRPDPITSYVAGYPVIMSYRLKQITISLTGDNVVRSYVMEYEAGNSTRRSRLVTLTEIGAGSDNAPALPPTSMVWQDTDSPGFSIGPQSQLDQHLNQLGVQQMDVNGDGCTDVVQFWLDQNGAINATTYLATASADGPTFVKASNSLLGSFPQARQVFPVDLDGGGRTDLLIAYKGSNGNLKLATFLSNGAGFDQASGSPFDTGDPWYDSNHLNFFAMDANGDGRTDLVEAYAHHDPNLGDLLYFRTYLSEFGDGPDKMFADAIISSTEDPANPTTPLAFWAMDVNGDGMMDLVRIWQRGSDQSIIATAYISVSLSIDQVSFAAQVESDLGTFNLADQKAFLPVDVNGNGVMDLLQVWQEPNPNGTTLHLTTFLCNAAGGFVAGPDTALENRTLGDFYPMGFNGGGLTALVNKWISGSEDLMFTVYMASPSGRFWEQTTFNAGLAGSAVKLAQFFPGDFNGDGKADLLRMAPDANQQVSLVPYVSSGPYPDLVTSITNPLGDLVKIQYLPMTDSRVYSQSSEAEFPKVTGLRYCNPLTPTQFPVQAVLGQATYVVSEYSQSNDPSLNRFSYSCDYSMSYSGARIDLLGRGWEGFNTFAKLDRTSGRNTVRTFNQDYPFTGTQASNRIEANGNYATDPRVPKSQDAVLLIFETSQFRSYTRAVGVTGLKTPVVEVLEVASRQEHYDYGADYFDYALGQSFDYDDYGNQKTHVQLGYVDQNGRPLDPSAEVYRYNLYENDVSTDGWRLGFLRYAKVSANATDADITQFLPGDYRLEQNTYTASTLNLASRSQWDNVHNGYLTTSYQYDAFGNRITETAPGGAVTKYDYEPDYNTFRMRMTSPADAQGVSLVTEYGFDPRFGIEVAQRQPNQAISIKGLDPFGRKMLAQGPVPTLPGAVGDPNALTSLVTGTPDLRQAFLAATVVTLEATNYLNDGRQGIYTEVLSLQVFPVDSSRDFIWTQTYVDGLARNRETFAQTGQSAGNVATLTDYDGDGKIVLQSVPFFSTSSIIAQAPHATKTAYDVLDRPITRQEPCGSNGNDISTTTWEYQTQGQVTMASAAGSNTAYTQVFQHHFYDGADKVRQVVVPADGNATTSFGYDPIARMKSATDPATPTSPNGISNNITYDSLDRRLTFDNPDQNSTNDPNVKAMTYDYDPVTGQLTTQTDAAGKSIVFEYDNLNRVKTKTLSDGRVFLYTYDDPSVKGQGRLTQVKVEATDKSTESQFDFSYDDYGNVSKTSITIAGEPTPFVTTSIFDPQQRVVQQTMPDATTLVRDYSFGKLVSQSLDGARADYPLEQYNATGKAGTLIYGQGILPGPGVVTNYTFNPTGQVYGEVVSGSAGEVLNLAYNYDLLNQLLGITDQSGSANDQTFTYLNKRLQTSIIPGFDPASYQYDASGNLTSKEGVSYTYQAHFPLTGQANGNVVYSATVDPCGRTSTRTAAGQELTFAYDGLGCLRRVSQTATNATVREMLSDYLGNRLRQIDADGAEVLYINPAYQVTRPANGAASITKFLLDNRGAAASITSGPASGILYFRRDYKGSTTETFGSDGTLASRVSYNGYGQYRMLTGADDFQLKYEQKEWDGDIGLYYFGARYYDPMTGRFLTPDSQLGAPNYLLADVLNRYAFELNNPINNIDPTGHGLRDVLIGIGIGLLLIGIGAAIILSGGAAAPVGAIFAGAFLGAGLNGVIYASTHRDQSAGTFYKGFLADAAVGALIGGITGGVSFGVGNIAEAYSAAAVRGMAEGFEMRMTSFIARSLVYVPTGMALGASGDAFNQFMSNVIDRNIGGEDVSLDEGVGRAALTGFIFGTVAGLGQAAAEARLLKTSYRMGDDVLNSEPIQMEILGPNEGTALVPNGPPPYTRIIKSMAAETVKARALLFGISESSAIADATLEAAGF